MYIYSYPCAITKDKKPSMKDLNRHVVPKYASKWENITTELGLDESTIEIIETLLVYN